ncbi:MAG: DsbC family protein [Thiotrichales bacterium]
MRKRLLAAIAAAAVGFVAAAQADDLTRTLEQKLLKVIPNERPDSITATPAKGLYEVVYGGQVLYITEDGKYLLDGQLLDLESRKNLTEAAQNSARGKVMASVKDADTIMFAPKGKPKHTITVFTDIDCGYCQKLHREMESYNDAGIAVRYMMFPRAGVGSDAYKKAVSVWCADNQQDAMTKAKNRESVKDATCANPVEQHYALGQQVGVTGTPAIVLEGGQIVPGYRPAKELATVLDQLAQKK